MLSTTTRSTLLIPSDEMFWVGGFGSKPPPVFVEFPELFSPAKADASCPDDANAAAAKRFAT